MVNRHIWPVHLLLCFLLFCTNWCSAADLDLHYKFAAASKPTTLLENTWGAYQTELFSGSFGYGFPIKVPPGVNGLQPDLQLSYNSHSAHGKSGWVGAGWDLPVPYIQRDINYTRKDTSDDSFDLYLGGKNDLVFVTADGRYRTSVDTFYKIEALNADGSQAGSNKNPAYWIVRMKDGTQYRFGRNADSRKIIQTSDTSFTQYNWRWHLDEIKDPNGNTVTYQYQQVHDGSNNIGAVYLSKIIYNNDNLRLVEFIRDANPVAYLTINQGSEEKIGQRLKQIDIKVSDSLVRRYVLDYAQNALGTNLFLTKITEIGSDGVTALPPTTFTYQGFTPGFSAPQAWGWSWNTPVRDTSSGNDTRKDVLDVNGDGLPDRAYENNGWKVRLNKGGSFSDSESEWSWNIGHPFRDAKSPDNNSDSADSKGTPMDMNRDGYIDYVWAEDADLGEAIQINFGNSGGFGGIVSWAPPTNDMWVREVRSLGENEPNVKAQMMDINGDGYPDYVQRVEKSGWNCWMGTGNGFGQYVFLPNPRSSHEAYLWDYQRDNGAHETEVGFYDMNGDGLEDLVDANDSNWQVYLNTGSNFIYGGSWAGGEKYTNDPQDDGDERHDLFDINGDGLPDKVLGQQAGYLNVRFNTGRGFTGEQQWPTGKSMPDNLIRDVKDNGSEVARDFVDLNGDGLVDMVFQTSGDWEVSRNLAQKTDLMTRVQTSFGGTVVISYRSSRDFPQTRLPFNYWLVSTVVTNNGMSGDHAVSATTSYSYEGGLYDFPTREFRGFSKVIETLADNSKVEHLFYQDIGRKGKQDGQSIYAQDGRKFVSLDDTWSSTGSSGVYTIRQTAGEQSTWDGSNTARTIRTEYANYDTYGNSRLVRHKEDIGISSDDWYENTQFSYNTANWIVNKPTRKYISSTEGGAALRDTKFYYDGNDFNVAPSKGNLTKQIQEIDTGDDAITQFTYDSYGNKNSTIDPEGRQSRVEFDSTFHTFPVTYYNAKNQVSRRTVAPASGNSLTEINPNGNTTFFEYDVFLRLNKKILPYDSSTYPTEARSYAIDGIAPEYVRVSKREISGNGAVLESFQFVDGFGNLIQAKTESASGANQIALSYFYDKLGRIEKQSNPLFVSASGGYTSASKSAAGLSFTYDAIGRPVKVTNPDGTFKTRIFDHWVVTEQDENTHEKVYTFDAHQHPLSIAERNGGETYTTNYQYNIFGELAKITDHMGNITQFSFDSLGRKTAISDPDLGNWSYGYDRASNLFRQTDAKGNEIQTTYDELNRKVKEVYPHDDDITFTYDNPTIGAVSKIVDAAGEVSFLYDQRLRKTKETRKIDSFSWSTEYSYDAMDRVIEEKRPNGETAKFQYDSQGLLDNIADVVTNLDYNASGQLTSRTYANGKTCSMGYHSQNSRLTSLQTPGLINYSYQYDNAGNIGSITNGLTSTSETYNYDSLNRLTSASGPGYAINYTINDIGNITQVSKNGSNDNYYYGKNNSLPHAPTLVSTSTPVIEKFTINNGALWTTSKSVTLNAIVTGSVTEYMVSENASFSGGQWVQFINNPTYQLSGSSYGERIIYLKVRNGAVVSEVHHARITYSGDSNNDNIPDILDVDRDGMLDSWELLNGLNPANPADANADRDGDGLSNINELRVGSNPNSTDTDGDQLSDYWEFTHGINPTSMDSDNDGLNDNMDAVPNNSIQQSISQNFRQASFQLISGGGQRVATSKILKDNLSNGLTPLYTFSLVSFDGDNDGIANERDNCADIYNPTQEDIDVDSIGDACDPDNDNDGIKDTTDNCYLIPNPDQKDNDHDGQGDTCDTDDDNDGMPDEWEIKHGLNPFNANDAGLDPDKDGFSNLAEYGFGTNPIIFDDDGNMNGVPDDVEKRGKSLKSVFLLLLD